MTLNIVNWNIAWATRRSPRANVIRQRIFAQNPEIVCVTEGYVDFFADTNGYFISSEADYGYPLVAGRRKVLLWSKRPWQQVDSIGSTKMPNGRFVQAVTETSIGQLLVIGLCIPWQMAHVSNGNRNRQPWQDHEQFLEGLGELLSRLPRQATIVSGDFNQRIPRTRVPRATYASLEANLLAHFHVATAGKIVGEEKQTIDHILHSRDLHCLNSYSLSSTSATVKTLSDHFGVVATLSLA